MATNLTYTCRNCYAEIAEDDVRMYEYDSYCPSCADDLFATCDDCGELVFEDSLTTTQNRNVVCEDCLSENYTSCSDCEDYIANDDIAMYDDSTSLCFGCAQYYLTCDDCGCIIHQDNSYCNDYDNASYCRDCYREHERRIIHDYSFKPYPEFRLAIHETRTQRTMFLGVENEVDDGDNREECAERIQALSDNVYLKEDSSLNHGFEIVSHPCTLDYHRDELAWKAIFKQARYYGFKSHSTTTCGLHVHVSRGYFGKSYRVQDLNIAKVIILTNKLWDQLVIASRRDMNHRDSYGLTELDHWAKKVETYIEPSDTRETIIVKTKQTEYRGRYQAWNLENDSTIECRMFRGTLVFETFLATLELVAAICTFARRHSLREVQRTTWADFRATCADVALLAYLESKGL